MTSAIETKRPTALYRFFSVEGALLYVGIAFDPDSRAKQHAATKSWWGNVDQARTTVEWHPDREAAETAELAAIRAENPLHNIVRSDENGCAIYAPNPNGRSWGRPTWTLKGAAPAQLRLRTAAAKAAKKADQAEAEVTKAVRAAHEAGVPMEDLAEQTGRSRATLFRQIKQS